MRLSDLQHKDVVNITTGEKIGNVIDVEISDITGNILKLIIFEKKGIINTLRGEECFISWEQIKKIGTDVILVNKSV